MSQKITQVDAFTDQPFGGNPAAVCILPEAKADDWMQSVAVEMNLSETAFLIKQNDGYSLRWFTPAYEVDLCGHATLTSAHVLWEDGHCNMDETIRFHTRSGLLSAQNKDGWIELDFPAIMQEADLHAQDLKAALDLHEAYVGKNKMDYLVEIDDEHHLRELQPDMNALKKINARGVIVTAKSKDERYDFVSRFFAPGAGVDEDPVTGSAHCCLAPYWGAKLGKTEMVGYQASKRGGVVKVRWQEDRVYLQGKAVTTMRGDLVC